MRPKPKGIITLAVGLPGSGKSTYFARRGIQPLCSDTIRLWLLDDETDQSAQHRKQAGRALYFVEYHQPAGQRLEIELRLGELRQIGRPFEVQEHRPARHGPQQPARQGRLAGLARADQADDRKAAQGSAHRGPESAGYHPRNSKLNL